MSYRFLTPLHIATDKGNLDILDTLLKHSAKVNILFNTGFIVQLNKRLFFFAGKCSWRSWPDSFAQSSYRRKFTSL